MINPRNPNPRRTLLATAAAMAAGIAANQLGRRASSAAEKHIRGGVDRLVDKMGASSNSSKSIPIARSGVRSFNARRGGRGLEGFTPDKGQIQIAALVGSTTDGQVVTSLNMNPMILGGRAEVLATIFQQYAVRKLVVEYNPTIAATTAGSFMLAFDSDMTEVPTVGSIVLPSDFSQFRNATQFNGRDRFSKVLAIQRGKDVKWLFTDPNAGELHTTSPGALMVCTNGGCSAITYGNFTISWHYDFKLDRPPSNPGEVNLCRVPMEDKEPINFELANPASANDRSMLGDAKDGVVWLPPHSIYLWSTRCVGTGATPLLGLAYSPAPTAILSTSYLGSSAVFLETTVVQTGAEWIQVTATCTNAAPANAYVHVFKIHGMSPAYIELAARRDKILSLSNPVSTVVEEEDCVVVRQSTLEGTACTLNSPLKACQTKQK